MANFKSKKIASAIAKAFHLRVASIIYVPGYKNLKGELEPWVIRKKANQEILGSFKTKNEAEVSLVKGEIFDTTNTIKEAAIIDSNDKAEFNVWIKPKDDVEWNIISKILEDEGLLKSHSDALYKLSKEFMVTVVALDKSNAEDIVKAYINHDDISLESTKVDAQLKEKKANTVYKGIDIVEEGGKFKVKNMGKEFSNVEEAQKSLDEWEQTGKGVEPKKEAKIGYNIPEDIKQYVKSTARELFYESTGGNVDYVAKNLNGEDSVIGIVSAKGDAGSPSGLNEPCTVMVYSWGNPLEFGQFNEEFLKDSKNFSTTKEGIDFINTLDLSQFEVKEGDKKAEVSKKADEPKPEEKKEEDPKTKFVPYTNVLKDKVNPDVAVQPSEDIAKALQQFKSTQSRLVALDNMIKLAKAKLEEEVARIRTEGGQVENQTQLDNLVNLIAQMLEKSTTQTVKFGDELIALYEADKTVPFKANDRWKLDKLRERYKDADEYLEKAIQGAKSLDTTEHIRELVWVTPKKTKTSAENKSILEILKDIYIGLKNFYVETVGIEDELEGLVGLASKKVTQVEKKAMGMFTVGDPVVDKAKQKGTVDKINDDGTLVVHLEDGMFETVFEHELEKVAKLGDSVESSVIVPMLFSIPSKLVVDYAMSSSYESKVEQGDFNINSLIKDTAHWMWATSRAKPTIAYFMDPTTEWKFKNEQLEEIKEELAKHKKSEPVEEKKEEVKEESK